MSFEAQLQKAFDDALKAQLERFTDNLSSIADRLKHANEDLELMTVKEVAKKMKSSQSTVYDLIEKGELRAFNVGHLKIAMEDYNEFINRKRKEEIA